MIFKISKTMKSMCIAIHSTLSLNVYLHSKQNLVGFYCLGFNDSKFVDSIFKIYFCAFFFFSSNERMAMFENFS